MPSNTLVTYPDGGNYVEVAFRIYPDTNTPERFHIATGSPKFVDENGERPGLHLVVSANPASADYNPATYNRLVRFWNGAPHEHMVLHGHSEVPVEDRKLKTRFAKAMAAGLKPRSAEVIGRG